MMTLKISHSILSAWKSGKWEDAVSYYLGRDVPATDAMQLGRLMDEKWTKYINETGKMPEELGGETLDSPRTQVKYQLRIPFSDEYEFLLRGVPDITTPTQIIDLKCGRSDANSYIGKMQLDYYSLFLPECTEGKYICFNPYTKKKTIGLKFLSQKNRDDALNDIMTFGGEMLDYLLANKLFKNYEGRIVS